MRKTLGAVIASTALVLLSACGGGAESSDGGSGSASNTPAAEKAAADSGPLTKDNFVDRMSAAQLEASTAHISMSASTGSEPMMEGVIETGEDAKSSKSQITTNSGMGKMDVRMVDGIMYLSMGEMTGGKFVKIDPSDPDDPLAQQFGSNADKADPTKQLEVFRDSLVGFDNQGDGGEIDGVKTTKIKLTLDTAKVMAAQGASSEAAASADMPKKLDYTVFVGDDDLMRRMVIEISGMSSTIDWTKWGEPVTVEAPPKDQITDSSALTDALGSM